jgi:glutathione S-transferase
VARSGLSEREGGSAAASRPGGVRAEKPRAPDFRLVTIPISHYCEKARWALDRAHVPYREERHVQGIHRIASRRAGGTGTVPVLVTPDGAIGESAQILEWADARQPQERRLFQSDPAARGREEALCVRFDEVLGPAGRRLIYVRMFAHPASLARRFNNAGVPRWEDLLTRAGWSRMQGVVAKALGIRPGVEVQDEETVFREFDHVAELLQDGRPFLLGERFGAADLTFASLCAPMLVPDRYGTPLPSPEELDEPTRELVLRARAHPAGEFALRVITQERGLRTAV